MRRCDAVFSIEKSGAIERSWESIRQLQVKQADFEPGFFSGKIPLRCDLELLRVCSICQEKKMFHKP